MTTPRVAFGPSTAEKLRVAASFPDRIPHPDWSPRAANPVVRQFDIAYLTPYGEIAHVSRSAPATPVFEEAFSALTRGTLIATEDGPIAVEDLHPGAMLRTVANGPQPLLWIGSTQIDVDTERRSGPAPLRLTRFAAESFGVGRPAPDLLLGPRARILYRSPRCQEMLGTSQAFAPAHGFIDGDSAVEITPFAPVRLYHLALHGQQVILANGIEVESYHPGPQVESLADRATCEALRELFPHVERLDGFGPMPIPRLTGFELETLRGG
ncbi:Hint domain-containing protein [Tropicimonas sp. IMCC6043]|uniref:Hint domain-containing protein n=1 Tax=Tropicimonas sp. IMCC6043 TaxID=2510645 RepID=UPI0013ED1D76|nr:Hint domain-containing protein [Tropicimonas sp. IMCC6043]